MVIPAAAALDSGVFSFDGLVQSETEVLFQLHRQLPPERTHPATRHRLEARPSLASIVAFHTFRYQFKETNMPGPA